MGRQALIESVMWVKIEISVDGREKKKSNNGDESSREPIKAETPRVDKAWEGGRRGEGEKKKKLSSALCSMVSLFKSISLANPVIDI